MTLIERRYNLDFEIKTRPNGVENSHWPCYWPSDRAPKVRLNMSALIAHGVCGAVVGCLCVFPTAASRAQQSTPPPKAFIDGTGPGWRALGEEHFVNVNCDPDTWSWTNGMVRCTGKPV